MKLLMTAISLVAAVAVVRAQDGSAAQPVMPSADSMLSHLKENDWSLVLMDTPNRKILFTFGDLGRQVVELKWARDRGASLGEQQQRLNGIFGEDGASHSAGDANGFVSTSGGGADWSARAYADLSRAAQALNGGDFRKAQNDVTLVESEAEKLPPEEREDYAAAAAALRRMNGVMASGESLRRLVHAAPRGDFSERQFLQKSQRFYARGLGLDTEEFLDAADAVWEAYKTRFLIPEGSTGDLADALAQLDAAEHLVQTRYKRSDYVAAMERVWKDAAGLSASERAALAARLHRHAQMWNTASADALAFAWYATASRRPEFVKQRQALIAQAQWQGTQGGRADALARSLLQGPGGG